METTPSSENAEEQKVSSPSSLAVSDTSSSVPAAAATTATESPSSSLTPTQPAVAAPKATSNLSSTSSTARTVRATVTSRPARSRLGAKPGKLGVRKAPANFNFEEAEARAKEESERKAKLGYDEAEEEAQEASEGRGKSLSSRLAYQESSTSQASKDKEKEEEAFEKLGFGMSRMGINSASSSNNASRITGFGSNTSRHDDDEQPTQSAREKFGNAKAISSDQFFGRNEYDPAISAEHAGRLSQFQSARAISSDQYFGREEETSSPDRVEFGNDWDSLQDQAVMMARKFVGQASADLDAVRDLAENATSKVK